MAYGERVAERVRLLSQEPEQLRSIKGQVLYEQLRSLGITYNAYFRAADTSLEEYCAEEFGVDLRKITVDRFSSRTRTRSGCSRTSCVKRWLPACVANRYIRT
jgi:hypothetical protein